MLVLNPQKLFLFRLLIFNEFRNVPIENTIPLAVIQAQVNIEMPITEI